MAELPDRTAGDEVPSVTETAEGLRGVIDQAQPWCLRVVWSPDPQAVGRVTRVGDGLVLGRVRRDGVTLAIADSKLSRRHASLTRDDVLPRWTFRDEGSKNGCFVEGKRVCGSVTLEGGALLRLGDTLLELRRERISGALDVRPDDELVGHAAPHLEVLEAVRRVAPTEMPVLLLGETGTGKELVARKLHETSGRAGPFVAVNCAAIPAALFESYLFGHQKGAFTGAVRDQVGHFEAAAGGTLLLDEIGELPLVLQPKLLRVLETSEVTPVGKAAARAVEARVVAATNVDLRKAVAEGAFRGDLYARLAGFVVRLPALRERRSDVPLLVQHFLRELAPAWDVRVEGELMERLVRYVWPLNVRELRAVVRRFALLKDQTSVLRAADLPADQLLGNIGMAEAQGAPASDEPSRDALVELLQHYRGNVVKVAKHLGKDRKQVYRWLERSGLQAAAYRGKL